MRRVLLALLTIAILPSPGASQDCIDYGDYLHWTGMVDTPPALPPHGVAVSGNYAYVADGFGLQVVDISMPDSPALVGEVATPGAARGVAVAGNYAYVADGSTLLNGLGLQVIDISLPQSPTLVAAVATPGSRESSPMAPATISSRRFRTTSPISAEALAWRLRSHQMSLCSPRS